MSIAALSDVGVELVRHGHDPLEVLGALVFGDLPVEIPEAIGPLYCLNGHPWNEENTRFTPRGHRRCLTCSREQKRAWKVRHAT